MVNTYRTPEIYNKEGNVRIPMGPSDLVDSKKLKRSGIEKPPAPEQCRNALVIYANICPCYMTGFPIIADDGDCILGHNCEHIIALAQLILLCGLAGKPFEDAIDDFFNNFSTLLSDNPDIVTNWKDWRKGIVGRYNGSEAREIEGGGVRGSVYSLSNPAPNHMKDNHALIRIDFGHPDGIRFLKSDSSYQIHNDWMAAIAAQGAINVMLSATGGAATGGGDDDGDDDGGGGKSSGLDDRSSRNVRKGTAPYSTRRPTRRSSRSRQPLPSMRQQMDEDSESEAPIDEDRESEAPIDEDRESEAPMDEDSESAAPAAAPPVAAPPAPAAAAAAPPPVVNMEDVLCVEPDDCMPLDGDGENDVDKNKIICWQSIYWLLCSLIGKNQGGKDGGNKSSEWRSSILRLTGTTINTGAANSTKPKGSYEFGDRMIKRPSKFAREPQDYQSLPDETSKQKTAKETAKREWSAKLKTRNMRFNNYVEGKFWLPRLENEIPIVEIDPTTNCITKLPLIINGVSHGNVNADVWIGLRARKIADQLKNVIDKINTEKFRNNRLSFTAFSTKVFAVYLYKKKNDDLFGKMKIAIQNIIKGGGKLKSKLKSEVSENLSELIEKISIVFTSDVFKKRLEQGQGGGAETRVNRSYTLVEYPGKNSPTTPLSNIPPPTVKKAFTFVGEQAGEAPRIATEADRLAAEAAEADRLAKAAEADRLAAEAAEADRLAKAAEAARIAAEVDEPGEAPLISEFSEYISGLEGQISVEKDEIIEYYRVLCRSLGFFDPLKVDLNYLEGTYNEGYRGKIINRGKIIAEALDIEETFREVYDECGGDEYLINNLLDIKELYNSYLYDTGPEDEPEPEPEGEFDAPGIGYGKKKKTKKKTKRRKNKKSIKKKTKRKSKRKNKRKTAKKKKKQSDLIDKIIDRLGY